jgi:hypothetical protein
LIETDQGGFSIWIRGVALIWCDGISENCPAYFGRIRGIGEPAILACYHRVLSSIALRLWMRSLLEDVRNESVERRGEVAG